MKLKEKYINTKKQGDAGLGVAIAWFAINGHGVNIPLTDSQDYDIVVDIDGCLKRVQVKTSSYKSQYGIFFVSLTVKGGNRSCNTIKKLNCNTVDLIFVVTSDGDNYLIPSKDIEGQSSISLGKEYRKYKIG